MIRMYFDTEATHRPLLDEDASSPGQPHLTRIGAILSDDGVTVMQFQAIVRPDGWQAPDSPFCPSSAYQNAVPVVGVLTVMAGFIRLADEVFAYGLDIHKLVLEAAYRRAAKVMPEIPPGRCLCRVAKTAWNFPRLPSLAQAMEKVTGVDCWPKGLAPLEDAGGCEQLHLHLMKAFPSLLDAPGALAA